MEVIWNPHTPKLTVDVIIETKNGIVLIKRRNKPFGWALPGGFVEIGETVENAARREAFEETSLRLDKLNLLGVYSDPKRDPRFHTVSVVFASTSDKKPVGGDDASLAKEFTVDNLPDLIVFDHKTILSDYLNNRE